MKSLKPLGKIIGLLIVILTLTSVSKAGQAIPTEFWISTNATGNFYPSAPGTIDSPLDGSSQVNFDANMSSLPPNSAIHILAGTYQTFGSAGYFGIGGFVLKSGQKVYGSGIDVTVLQLATNVPDHTFVLQSLAAQTNIEVSDLTCDCTGTQSHSGVKLDGAYHAVRRVKVIDACGYTSGEAWGIVIQNVNLPDSVGNIIEECEVSHINSDVTITAITFNFNSTLFYGISGISRNNRVFLDNAPAQFGLGGGNHDGLVEGNYVVGADEGLHFDTGSVSNLSVVNNTFKSCGGIGDFHNGQSKNVTFAFNRAELTNAPYSVQVLAFNFYDDHGATYTNLNIIGNTVIYTGDPTSLMCFIRAYNTAGLNVANNSVDSILTNGVFDCQGINMNNNFDLLGNLLPYMNYFSGDGSYLNNITPANISPGTAAISISGNSTTATTAGNFTGSLSGDVTGTQSATAVASVGGQTAASVASGASAANAATSANTPNAIVKRDGSGNFSADAVSLASTLTAGGNIIESAGNAYVYDGVNMAYGLTGFNDYFLAGAGNNTMAGGNNTAIGFQAFQNNTNGFYSTAVGWQALNANTIGFHNTAVGAQAMCNNTNGAANVAFGVQSLYYALSGDANAAFGRGSLFSNSIGSYNTAIGDQADRNTPNSSYNTTVGSESMYGNVSGYGNSVLGTFALGGVISGSSNIVVGFNTGLNIVNGSDNIYIGASGPSDEYAITRIGTGQTDAYIAGVLHLPSDLDVSGNVNVGGTVTGAINPTNVLPVASLPVYSYTLGANWSCRTNNNASSSPTNTPIAVTVPAGTYEIQANISAANNSTNGTGGGIGIGYALSGNVSYANQVLMYGALRGAMSGAIGSTVSNACTIATSGSAGVGQFLYTGQLTVTNTCTYTIQAGVNSSTTNGFYLYPGSGLVLTRIK